MITYRIASRILAYQECLTMRHRSALYASLLRRARKATLISPRRKIAMVLGSGTAPPEHQTCRQNQTCIQRLHESTSFGKKGDIKAQASRGFCQHEKPLLSLKTQIPDKAERNRSILEMFLQNRDLELAKKHPKCIQIKNLRKQRLEQNHA